MNAERFRRFLRILSYSAGPIICAGALAVLAGWLLDIRILRSFFPGTTEMKPNAALGLLGGALALWLLQKESPFRRLASMSAAAFSAALGFATLSEYLLGWDLRIDQALFQEAIVPIGTSSPGRMALGTAFSLGCCGIGLLLEARKTRAWIGQMFALGGVLLPFLSLVDYSYNVQHVYGLRTFVQMSPHTAILMLLLGIGLVCRRPQEGMMEVVTTETLGGVMLRRLLPPIAFVPVILGWIRVLGIRLGLFTTELGLSIVLTTTIGVFIALIWVCAYAMHKLDVKRQQAEIAREKSQRALSTLNSDLEKEVTSRTQELRQKDAELFQARKLEAIGRLAGGIAHDFNNIITGILGVSEEIQESFAPDDARRHDMDQVVQAANKAFLVTRQLLAFARRQVTQPQVVDLNARIIEAEKMLRPLLGEDIRIALSCNPIARIRIDPGHLEQVLMNLALNAREAMPTGGTLSIHTSMVDLGDTTGVRRLGAPAGSYVVLAISDEGSGISPNTLDHLFEPFFSTKEGNQGTGLGLSTVYGIVQQCGGDIEVSNGKEKGATFKIYFPPVGAEAPVLTPAAPTASKGRDSTILVVEDESIVRRVVVNLLRRSGYRILEAVNGFAALQASARHEGSIDMVITDVVMPGMNGRQMVEMLRQSRPGIAVLYTSGYPEDIIAHRGQLEPGIEFLEKGAITHELLDRVDKILAVKA